MSVVENSLNGSSFNGNSFRFSLFQGKELMMEKVFDADCFSPGVRNFVNIKEILPSIVTKLQKLLSADEYDVVFGAMKNGTYQTYYDLYLTYGFSDRLFLFGLAIYDFDEVTCVARYDERPYPMFYLSKWSKKNGEE